jgi:NAD(P)H-flavin reductase
MEFKSRILDIKKCSDKENFFEIIKFEKPKDFSFVSGQFVMISMDDFKLRNNSEQLKWSSFSIASAPFQEYIELCIRVHFTGGLTHHLSKKKEGALVNFKGPFGNFTLNKNFREAAFVALGTGIAPLISMIRSLLHEHDSRPITLFYGFRNSHCFLYREELMKMQEIHSNFKLYFIASEPEENWKGEKGFVQDLIEKAEFGSKKEIDFYLCGIPRAIEEIRDFLVKKGFNKEKIFFERW